MFTRPLWPAARTLDHSHLENHQDHNSPESLPASLPLPSRVPSSSVLPLSPLLLFMLYPLFMRPSHTEVIVVTLHICGMQLSRP